MIDVTTQNNVSKLACVMNQTTLKKKIELVAIALNNMLSAGVRLMDNVYENKAESNFIRKAITSIVAN